MHSKTRCLLLDEEASAHKTFCPHLSPFHHGGRRGAVSAPGYDRFQQAGRRPFFRWRTAGAAESDDSDFSASRHAADASLSAPGSGGRPEPPRFCWKPLALNLKQQ